MRSNQKADNKSMENALDIMEIEPYLEKRLSILHTELVSTKKVDGYLKVYIDDKLKKTDRNALEKDCMLKFRIKVRVLRSSSDFHT